MRGSSVQQTGCGTHGTNQRGQTIAEMGLIVVLSILIVLGIIEFGYAFMALNVVTQATSAGARAASALQVGSRGTCGLITDASAVDGQNGLVRSQIGKIATVADVTVTQLPTPKTSPTICDTFSGSTIPTVTVTVTGSLPHLFGLLGSSAFNFTRVEVFRDEGR